jgi:hypothetical protein
MKSFTLAGLVLAAAMFHPVSAPAQAVSDNRLRDLTVLIRDIRPEPEFGRYPVFMRRLAQASRKCKLADTWEWGASVLCDAANGIAEERVLISMGFSPSRHPEALMINMIQPRGRNGGEIRKPAEVEVFMREYLGLPPRSVK